MGTFSLQKNISNYTLISNAISCFLFVLLVIERAASSAILQLLNNEGGGHTAVTSGSLIMKKLSENKGNANRVR